MEPHPVLRYLRRLQEKAASEEEDSCCGDHDCITSDVTRNKCTNEHHVSVSSDQRGIKDEPEVNETASEMKYEMGDRNECETLNGKKREVNNEGGNDI
ncbi:hypothetical protein LOK49_LG14G00059 [Camellia lanceoleosa]|uniref:Uncharacterized protein n=1 Tax=Camellia lanceoleosa TaxID=1840588 RepID=A0ACC0FDK6_9ERIC|nr:hypothetical protein LOK49_LG14G00059 [Camellia lanceoleosa]